MARKIITEEQRRYELSEKLCEQQKNKKFDYKLEDFEIYDSQWRHKDWKVWMKGAGRYDQTKKIVENYILECSKPYGERNLDDFHSIRYDA